MQHYYQDIPGWFDFDGIYAQWVREARADDATIVEVGSFAGRSAAFLGVEIANSGRPLRMVCVDPFTGMDNGQPIRGVTGLEHLRPTFERNIAPVREALGDRFLLMPIPSVQAAATFADRSLEYVYIDGDHARDSIAADLAAWWPKIAPGGELAGHDFDWPEVLETVEAFATRQGLDLRAAEPRSWRLRKPALLRAVDPWFVSPGDRSCLIVPMSSLPTISSGAAESLMRVVFGERVTTAARDNGFARVDLHWERSMPNVDAMRDLAILTAIKRGFSHVLFLDVDMRWPQDTLARMLQHHDAGIVSALYFQRHEPYLPVALRFADPIPDYAVPLTYAEDIVLEAPGLHRVDVVGMGCTLLPVELFRQYPRPWFKYQHDPRGWPTSTEDTWACQQAAAIGCPVWVDTGITCAHEFQSLSGKSTYLARRASRVLEAQAKAQQAATDAAMEGIQA